MKKLHLIFLLFMLWVPLRQVQGQSCSATNRENCIYVSTFADGRIYRFDATTNAATLIHDGSTTTVPERPGALVEGPDKLLYYSDALTCEIRRLNPFAPLTSKGLNTTLEMVLPSGSICPAGLTFDADGQLYANARPAAVYKIANGSATILPGTSTNSNGVAGITFSNRGDLLFVGQNPDRVLFSSALNPPFSSTIPLITVGLQEPIGIAQDKTDKIFVANRQTKNIVRCDSNGGSCTQFATFADPVDRPVYVDANSEGSIFVATEQFIDGTGATGKIWRLTGPGPHQCPSSSSLSNCQSVGSIPKVKGKIGPAHGIAVSATSAILAKTFGPGPDGTFGTPDDIKAQFFDFGTSLFGLSYPSGVLRTHTVTVKAQEVFPGDLNFPSPATQCTSYHGKRGKCVAYELINSIPIKGVDFTNKYGVYMKYAGQIPIQPAPLHDSRTLPDILKPGGADFPDNLFSRYDQGPPGVDPGMGGESTDQFTAYLSADLGALNDTSSTAFLTPIDPTQTPSAIIKRGQGLPVKISVNDNLGNTVLSAILRLGVARIVGNDLVPEDVLSNTNSENRFRIQSNVYLYNLITDDMPPGLHVLTVVSDSTSPFKIPPLITVIEVTP
jgi:sugar lactone lactonase YvrE